MGTLNEEEHCEVEFEVDVGLLVSVDGLSGVEVGLLASVDGLKPPLSSS